MGLWVAPILLQTGDDGVVLDAFRAAVWSANASLKMQEHVWYNVSCWMHLELLCGHWKASLQFQMTGTMCGTYPALHGFLAGGG